MFLLMNHAVAILFMIDWTSRRALTLRTVDMPVDRLLGITNLSSALFSENQTDVRETYRFSPINKLNSLFILMLVDEQWTCKGKFNIFETSTIFCRSAVEWIFPNIGCLFWNQNHKIFDSGFIWFSRRSEWWLVRWYIIFPIIELNSKNILVRSAHLFGDLKIASFY